MNSDISVKIKTKDLLNRYHFATDIVKSLLTSFINGQDSIVIGINGAWGCGKSSLLEFIKSEILIQTKIDPYRNIIFDFNPWRFQGAELLLVSFLQELGMRLGNYNIVYEKLKSDFNNVVDAIDRLNEVNPQVSSKITIKGLRNLIQLLQKSKSIDKLKQEADERLSDKNIKLFVFIDDLDRCTPNEIIQLFQIIKLNANFKNTIFFVAYDKEIVLSSLKKEYGRNGEKYLEKIVQIDYLVPKIIPEKLKSLFGENLSNFSNKFKLNISLNDIESVWESGLNKYYKTLRDIYRLLNALELRISIIIEDIYPFDFLILESIRIFEYQTYEWIYKNRENLIYKPVVLLPIDTNETEEPSKIDFIQKHSELVNKSLETKSLLTVLFDVDDSNNKGPFSGKRSNLDIDLNKRIASEKYFDHYFSFEVSSQNLPTKEIKSFIESDKDLKKSILNSHITDQKFDKFLEQLSGILTSGNSEHKLSIMEVLLDFSDECKLETKRIGEFKVNGLDLILRTLKTIGKTLNLNEQELLIKLILTGNKESYSRFYLTDQLYSKSNGKVGYPETDFIDISIINANLDSISNKLKIQIRYFGGMIFKDPAKYDIDLVKYFLSRYYDFYPLKYKQGVMKCITDPNSVIIFLRCSLTQVRRSGYDQPGFNLTEKYQLPEFSIQRFDELISNIDSSRLDEENKKYFALFNKIKENRFNRDQFFTIDLEHWTL